ncbi:MAG TPA: signal recognition particle-docking protein FtsY, partial [Candidatus Binatia bacterium]|nr:signal recognition particle-docking protein FtsY [Candidatus Binatia bacterium]
FVAADTFRAAAVEQLEIWGERVGADIIKHQSGADPSAVVFDGLQAAKKRGADVVMIDTAGRLHNKAHLVEELKKIRRVIAREQPGAPHETLLVLDAITGQNGLQQARVFQEAMDLTGIVLTKLDGTAKGGVVVAIQEELRIPVQYIGVGEDVDDLQSFEPESFVQALFEPRQ